MTAVEDRTVVTAEHRVVPRPASPPRRRPSTAAVADALGRVLLAAGVVVIGFVGWAASASGWIQHRDQHHLQASLTRVVDLARVGGAQRGGFFASHATKVVTPTSPAVAMLSIPSLGLRQAVLEGASASHLAQGPALVAGGAAPGGDGNVVIAGHRSVDGAPFYRLDRLRRGDTVVVTTALGRFTYDVVAVDEVAPHATAPVGPLGDRRLTLTAGDPVFSEGHPLAVEALLASTTRWPSSAAPAAALPGTRPHGADLPGDPWGWLAAVGGAALCAAGGLGVALRARLGAASMSAPAAWLLAGPVVAAGLCTLYAGVLQGLPGTL